MVKSKKRDSRSTIRREVGNRMSCRCRQAAQAAKDLEQARTSSAQLAEKLASSEAAALRLQQQVAESRADSSALSQRDAALLQLQQHLAAARHDVALAAKDLELRATEIAHLASQKTLFQQQAEEEKVVAERACKTLEQREAWWQRKLQEALAEAGRQKQEELQQAQQQHDGRRTDLEKTVEALQQKITLQSIEAFESLRQGRCAWRFADRLSGLASTQAMSRGDLAPRQATREQRTQGP